MTTTSGFRQSAVDENIAWFQDNAKYMQAQQDLELYQYIELMVEREIAGEGEVLDIGNGGFFNYDPSLARRVMAVDLFVQDGPGPTPNSSFHQGSILELPLEDQSIDCVLIQNVLHHVVGSTVEENHKHLARSMQEMYRCLRGGGKAVIIESTVGKWFYPIERALYRPLLLLKRGGHPVTFQYTPEQIITQAQRAGFKVVEYADVPSRGLIILQFGVRWPTMLTPARPIKLILRKP